MTESSTEDQKYLGGGEMCIRLASGKRVLARARIRIDVMFEPACCLDAESESFPFLQELYAGRRSFAVKHSWDEEPVRAFVSAVRMRSATQGNAVEHEVDATFVPDNRSRLRVLEDADEIELSLAYLPEFRRTMAARKVDGVRGLGLVLTSDDLEVRIRRTQPEDGLRKALPGHVFRHWATIHRPSGAPIRAKEIPEVLRDLDLFLRFLTGSATYPTLITLRRGDLPSRLIPGPIQVSSGVGPPTNRISIGGHYERLELLFDSFTGLFAGQESRVLLTEALQWRDIAAAPGVPTVRSSAAYMALECLAYWNSVVVGRWPGASSGHRLSRTKFKEIDAWEKMKFAMEPISSARDIWLSHVYHPLAAHCRRRNWEPWNLIAKLRNSAMHVEALAKRAPYLKRLAPLAADYAVDAFNAVVLTLLGFRGPMPARAAPFNESARIRYPLHEGQVQ